MKILLLNHNVKGIGTYIRCLHFAKNLVHFGHSVTILTSAPQFIFIPYREIADGVEIICMPDIAGRRFRNGGLGPIDTLMRCLYLPGKQFDIVENFDHRPAVLYPALFGKYILGIPLVSEWTDLHGTGGSLNNRPPLTRCLIRPYEDLSERMSKKIAERLIVISHGLRDMALRLGIPKKKIIWIPGGADIENIKPQPKKDARQRLQLPIDKKLILYSAGTHYDIELLLSTINKIQSARPDAVLVTTGAMLEERHKRLLFDPARLIEFGFLPYKAYTELLPCADLFIFPFSNRTLNVGRWPNKIGDYMAAGRPIVSNKTGDIVEVFKEHDIGLLAADDPEEFAQNALNILANDEIAFKLGINARKAAEQFFDWRILTKRLEDCFFEVTGRKGKRDLYEEVVH